MKAARMEAAGRPEGMPPARIHPNSYPIYVFRVWHGMVVFVWLRLLARNRLAVPPARIPMVLLGVVVSLVNSSLNAIQTLIFAKRIQASVLEKSPIFIIGHWRTGTTHLHELLTVDDRFVAPTTLECVAPGHCLAFGWLLRKLTFVLPPKRPMDNMLVGWDQPQEDEFALMNLGFGSPYETMIFPNHRPIRHEFLNMTEVAPDEVNAWKTGLLGFLQQVNFRSSKEQKGSNAARRIVLKSPTHTARLHILREMFPAAKFIHVVRDPCDVFASTVRLWRALFDTQGCQTPELGPLSDGTPDLERFVFDTMDLLYRDFFAQVAEIPTENFCHVRYENLVREPIEKMSQIYRHLRLGSFDEVRPKLEAHIRKLDGYKTNEHRLSDQQKAEVCRRWGWYMDKFEYRVPAPAQGSEPNESACVVPQLVPA
jgi:hypothetical protein